MARAQRLMALLLMSAERVTPDSRLLRCYATRFYREYERRLRYSAALSMAIEFSSRLLL